MFIYINYIHFEKILFQYTAVCYIPMTIKLLKTCCDKQQAFSNAKVYEYIFRH